MRDKRPRQRADYYLEVLDNEILLYHPSRTLMLYLNPTAALIWQLCDGARTLPEIVSLLTDAYPEPQEHLARDVEATLRYFVDRGVMDFV